jgi:ammonium transporter, Amt family
LNSGDTAWVLMSAALVMLMTPALAFFYGGMVRKKNLLSTIMFSFSIMALISIQWILYGYSISFGPDVHGLIGNLHWFGLNGVGQEVNPSYAPTIPHIAFMLFQMMFAIITPALISGAFVERIKFSSFLVFSFLWATLVYDPAAHWVWGVGGWLRQMGALDFAGGTVVHITAGYSALAFSLVIKQRKGFSIVNMEPNNIPYTILGAGLLWFGWFGFNAGSALAANGLAAHTFLVTNTAAGAAALTWMAINWIYRRPSTLGIATGAVVGLASITQASGFVSATSAMIIGFVAAIVSYFCIMLRNKWKIDESLDVWACHGVGGTLGAIATGIFASKAINPAGADGLIYGNWQLLKVQLIMVATVIAYSFIISFVLAKIIDKVSGLSVSPAEEQVGLDISQHGEEAYY